MFVARDLDYGQSYTLWFVKPKLRMGTFHSDSSDLPVLEMMPNRWEDSIGLLLDPGEVRECNVNIELL